MEGKWEKLWHRLQSLKCNRRLCPRVFLNELRRSREVFLSSAFWNQIRHRDEKKETQGTREFDIIFHQQTSPHSGKALGREKEGFAMILPNQLGPSVDDFLKHPAPHEADEICLQQMIVDSSKHTAWLIHVETHETHYFKDTFLWETRKSNTSASLVRGFSFSWVGYVCVHGSVFPRQNEGCRSAHVKTTRTMWTFWKVSCRPRKRVVNLVWVESAKGVECYGSDVCGAAMLMLRC